MALTQIKDGNKVKIEGILSEVNLEDKNYTDSNGNNIEAIGGSIKVRVNTLLNKNDNKETELEIEVHMFSPKKKKDGGANPAYDSIKRVKDEFVSIAASNTGIDGADRIRITGASIQMNEYYNQSSQLVSFPRITASFVNKIRKEDCKPEATFLATFMVGEITEEVDKDGVATGRLKIMGMIPQYGGKIDVVPFYASNPGVVEAISGYWNPQDTVKAAGKLNFSSRTEETEVNQGFGESYSEARTISVSELVITGGNPNPLEGEFAINADDVADALVARKEHLAELKNKRNGAGETKPATRANRFANLGF